MPLEVSVIGGEPAGVVSAIRTEVVLVVFEPSNSVPTGDAMRAAYIAITILGALVYGFAAYLNFVRHTSVIAVAQKVRVPQSWMFPLGVLLAAGALGLLLGFAVPLIGTAAAVGLILYFLAAVGAHLRVRDHQVGNAAMFLLLAMAILTVGMAHRAPR